MSRHALGTALLAAAVLAAPGCDQDEGRTEGVLQIPDGGDGKNDHSEDPGWSGESWSADPHVLVYALDPKLDSLMGLRLSESQGWNDPHVLSFEYRDAIREATWGMVDYQVDAFYRVDEFPLRTDGERYDELGYLRCLNEGGDACLPDSPYETDLAYYADVLGWCDAAESGVDEIWVFGAPWFGMPESQMTGPGAYWLNSTPLETGCRTPLTIMAFSYHVPVANMLHNLGHRIESHMVHSFAGWDSARGPSPWEQFIRGADSGQPACGNVHYPPNTTGEYVYGDAAEVLSGCDGWLDYPQQADYEPEGVSCWTWGCSGDVQRNYLTWWMQHIPHREGEASGSSTNWYRYIFDYRAHM